MEVAEAFILRAERKRGRQNGDNLVEENKFNFKHFSRYCTNLKKHMDADG